MLEASLSFLVQMFIFVCVRGMLIERIIFLEKKLIDYSRLRVLCFIEGRKRNLMNTSSLVKITLTFSKDVTFQLRDYRKIALFFAYLLKVEVALR